VIGDLLDALLLFCSEEYDAGTHKKLVNTRSSSRGRELARTEFADTEYRFPRSAEKIHSMVRQLEATNYASFIH